MYCEGPSTCTLRSDCDIKGWSTTNPLVLSSPSIKLRLKEREWAKLPFDPQKMDQLQCNFWWSGRGCKLAIPYQVGVWENMMPPNPFVCHSFTIFYPSKWQFWGASRQSTIKYQVQISGKFGTFLRQEVLTGDLLKVSWIPTGCIYPCAIGSHSDSDLCYLLQSGGCKHVS